ncbi:hypothetical protein QBC36DRAFT_346093 [Triangularia setosa]|uniref:Calcineurin-like phosphoesterase domain-containing protein n=1 Tax=Triangularia setosa TaxID=2587417 RepID=A0AAN6W759_9PEZI|nr:hypothetical protein QBC36DRAFT_346093 [Podospora setosa]
MSPSHEKGGLAIKPVRNIISNPQLRRRPLLVVVLSLSFLVLSHSRTGYEIQQQLHSNSKKWFPPLRFKKDGTFQLSTLSDLQFGERPCGPKQDLDSVGVVATVLDTEPSTDFVVLNGDIVTEKNLYLLNGTAYVDMIAQVLTAKGVEWGSTCGNYDSGYHLTPTAIFEREKKYKGSRTGRWLRGGGGGGGDELLFAGFELGWGESGDDVVISKIGGRRRYKGEEELGKWESGEVEEGKWGQRGAGAGVCAYPYGGFFGGAGNGNRPVTRQDEGWCPDGRNEEGCGDGGQDGEFMEAVLEEGLLGLFVGHDHGDTWCSDYEKEKRRMFCVLGSIRGMGVGVSIEELRQGEMDIWVRLESGKVVRRVRLNGSYGRDEYEVVKDEGTHLPVDDRD